MESYLDITKGLHTDFEPIDQPAGTYKNAQNITRQLSGAIENEKGCLPLYTFLDSTRRVVGQYVLDNDIIYFSCTPDPNTSEIGVLSAAGSYAVITNDISLGFSLNTIVRAEAKKNFKGERVVYFTGKNITTRVLNIDNVPATNFDDNTKLQVTADMPKIDLVSVNDGGSLPTGVYQFGVRLLTRSTNATSVSLITNPISVVDENTTNRDNYDGALPQTSSNKAITLSISNIDTDYSFYEVIALTYAGSGNVLKSDIVYRGSIQNRTVIEFTYTSTSQFIESLDIAALTAENINYDSAEYIIQKDGILVLGGLSSSVTDYNFQAAANSIVIKYVIREADWVENINISNGIDIGTSVAVGSDYKNPSTAFEFKSYMRGEVYSFGIVPVFSNWSTGNVYHIPGQYIDAGQGNKTAADSTSKLLGTFKSTEPYPTGQGYPTGNIRHHVMPTLGQEPHIRNTGNSYPNTQVIRMLGVSVDLSTFLTTIPTNVKKRIIGYIVVKQKRTADNKSILTQGIATGHNTNTYATSATYAVSAPYAGKFPAINFAAYAKDDSIVAFYSPETIITKEDFKGATAIVSALEVYGNTHFVKDERTGSEKYVNILLNYVAPISTFDLSGISRTVDTSVTQYIVPAKEISRTDADAGSGIPFQNISTLNLYVETWRTPGYLFLKLTNGDLPIRHTLYNNGAASTSGVMSEIYYRFEQDTDALFFNNQGNNGAAPSIGVTARHIYNLTRDRVKQYGQLNDAKYHSVKSVLIGDIPTSSVIECYNGDTFITKFSVMSGSDGASNGSYSMYAQALSYVWLESSINCGYRHYEPIVGKEGDANYVQGTLPYYPKNKTLYTGDYKGLFNYSYSLGHPTGYNKQYSFENTIKTFVSVPITFELVTSFPNRLIYSEQSVEGEQMDAFRIILPNNYHDIPKEKGKITDLFIQANSLYVHTERSLWKTYFNEQVTQATSSGDVYLGNGGVFYRPSTEVITVKGGYAGTKSSSGCTTPFGRFFIDQIQKKVFMFSETLEEISDEGMFKYFKSTITDVLDKPFAISPTATGYVSGFDYDNKRWLLSMINGFTLSYSTQLKSWSSFHTYHPYQYTTVGDRLFGLYNNVVYEMNVGPRATYFNLANSAVPNDSQLSFVINDVANQTKTLDNIVLFTTSQNSDGNEQHYDTFNNLQVTNVTQNTGKCTLIVPQTFKDEFNSLGLFECFAKLKSNEFRIAVPNDLVLDVTQIINTPDNLDSSRAFRPRMQGKFFIVDLWYNNTNNNKLVLHNIGRIFRQRTR